MNYVPDLGRCNLWLWSGIIIILLTCLGVFQVQKWDKDSNPHESEGVGGKYYKVLLGCSFVVGCLNAAMIKTSDGYYLMTLVSIVWGCLLAACVMDVVSKSVYNYVWWVAGLAGIGLLRWVDNRQISGLILFVCLQEFFFCRLYGRADCHAFVMCAVVNTALGLSLREHFLQMLVAYGVLAVVQGWKNNIGKNGNLKEPVPFLPYIAVSLWMILFTMKIF